MIKMTLLLILTTIIINSQAQTIHFNDEQGTLTLPNIKITTKIPTYSVKLQQVNDNSSELILELDTYEPINNSDVYYDPSTTILYIPQLVMGGETYNQARFKLLSSSKHSPMQFHMIGVESKNTAAKSVKATVETEPVNATEDAADDPAIWVHPQDPAQSIIIGTQKQGGLMVYDLTGKQLQYLPDGKMNNVDLRYNFLLGEEKISIVTASNRTNNSIAIYKVNPDTRMLENVADRAIVTGFKSSIYGLCMYHNKSSNRYYVFLNDKDGAVEQWELYDNGGLVNAALIRHFSVSSQVEGCVVDDVLGHFYLGEELVGIWKFDANPTADSKGHLIDTADKNGNITPEVEGLAIYYLSEQEGYLIASNQGDNTFTVYNRAGNNEYLGRFYVAADYGLGIDEVDDTDGLDVINIPLGEAFPYGVFVAQDGINAMPQENQNFKLIPWERIADALGLRKNTSYSLH
ncbi:phytase [Candidatus Halobeggiatoa sp. HSG11]|nr:phytase [Candidatus Halobeggiatoa sp. HSG11]